MSGEFDSRKDSQSTKFERRPRIFVKLSFRELWDSKLSLNFKLYGPFLWMGFNCLKATEPLQGDSLIFTTKSPEVPATHLVDLERMKG